MIILEEFIPQYKKIFNQILQLAKELRSDNQPLPSERKLCEKYHASRTTIRRALRMLEERGVVKNVKGKGYVLFANTQLHVTSKMNQGFYSDMVAQGKKVKTQVLIQETIRARESVCQKLMLSADEDVFHLVRLRTLEDRIYSISESFIPVKCCSDIANHDFTNNSLWSIMHNYGIEPKVLKQYVFAKEATQKQRHLLELEESQNVLVVNSITYDRHIPVEDSYVYTELFGTKLELSFDDHQGS